MKLHLGCGKRYKEGYVNIDAKSQKADLLWDKLNALPYEHNSVSEIMAIHLFEHIWPSEAREHVRHWYSLLKPGGKLILEMPDLYKAARNYIRDVDRGSVSPNITMAMFPIFGDNPDKTVYDCHKWGWTFRTILPVLQDAGFKAITEMPTQWHGKRQDRDFRVEATK